MIESQLSQIKSIKSPLQEIWPPKWFFSYSDLATLLMTFFIILATMLSLNIPLTVFADKKLQEMLSQQTIRLQQLGELTEREKKVFKEIQDLELEQIRTIVQLERLKEFADQIRSYIKENKLEDFIIVEEGKWNVKVTPLAPFLFEKGKDVLRPESKPLLDQIGGFLKKYPSLIKIEGHTDNTPIHTPRFPSNWELSIARANSIMKYLLKEYRIASERIEAVGYGEYRPAFPNDSDENRAKNRRVVFEIIPILEKETF
ncbi:MAG: OmpA family protein [Candidatus Omnitrophica bacterium]|nr:OmpA family protein [Candidatus Omnitrophota bacterium]